MLVAAAVWTVSHAPTVPVLLAAAVAFGVCDAFYEPSAGTIGRQLVRTDDLPSYAAVIQTASRLGTMGAPHWAACSSPKPVSRGAHPRTR